MRSPTREEIDGLLPLIEAKEVADERARVAQSALGLAVVKLRRLCGAPGDAALDDCSFEWVRLEQTQQGPRRIPLPTE